MAASLYTVPVELQLSMFRHLIPEDLHKTS
jgi:hypothetical protein